MSQVLRDRARERCCDVLAAVPASAPTLCDGWDAHDLAVHLWVLSHDPLSWVGMVLPSMAAVTRRRAATIRRRWEYADLVSRLREGPAGFACMPLDRREEHRHALGEWFVHTQDVARPNGVPQAEAEPDLQDALWLRAVAAARLLHRRRTPGLILCRPGVGRTQVTPGAPRVVVTGESSELICWVYGRVDAARVSVTDAADG